MQKKKIIIDVRTPEEFAGGNVPGSINIPLHEIPHRLSEILSLNGPLLLCCASGSRSGQAALFLRSYGVHCENGGSWIDITENIQTN